MERETTRPIVGKIHSHLEDLFVVSPITK